MASDLRTLADVFAYAAAHGITLRIDGSEIQVRRPPARLPGRRAFVSGKKKMNTIKFTKICDGPGRTLWDGTFRPGRQHDQTALQTDGIDDLLDQFPGVRCEMDAGYRGLHRDHPGQVSVPPKKPAKDAAPEVTEPGSKPVTPSHRPGSASSTRSPTASTGGPCNAGPAGASTCPRPSRQSAHSYPTAPPPGNRASPANRTTTPPEDALSPIEHHVVRA